MALKYIICTVAGYRVTEQGVGVALRQIHCFIAFPQRPSLKSEIRATPTSYQMDNGTVSPVTNRPACDLTS